MRGPTKRNPLRKYGITLDDFDKLPEVNAGVNDFMANEVVPAWKSHAPTGKTKKNRTGHGIKPHSGGDDGAAEDVAYKDSIQVTEKSTTKGRGVVGATARHAHLVEFGADKTPEYAPAEKTAKQFGGSAYGK